MNDYPPNPTSRRPEGTWGQEDDGFRIIPPAGVSAPPVSSPMPAPAPVQAPPPRPVPVVVPVVAPPPARVPAKKPAAAPDRQKLYIAIGAGVVILAAIAFFFLVLWITKPGAVDRVIQGDVTACDELPKNPADTSAPKDKLTQAYYECGMHWVEPASADFKPNVATAMEFFQLANKVTPNKSEVLQQIEVAHTYQQALDKLPDNGAYIDALEWFTKQPDYAASAYADAFQRLYNAYLISARGYRAENICGLAQKRLNQAIGLKHVDTAEARTQLADLLVVLKKDPNICNQAVPAATAAP